MGNWAGNLKHGIGKKWYANGDSYEGLWNNGKAEGPGRCGAGSRPARTALPLRVARGGRNARCCRCRCRRCCYF